MIRRTFIVVFFGFFLVGTSTILAIDPDEVDNRYVTPPRSDMHHHEKNVVPLEQSHMAWTPTVPNAPPFIPSSLRGYSNRNVRGRNEGNIVQDYPYTNETDQNRLGPEEDYIIRFR